MKSRHPSQWWNCSGSKNPSCQFLFRHSTTAWGDLSQMAITDRTLTQKNRNMLYCPPSIVWYLESHGGYHFLFCMNCPTTLTALKPRRLEYLSYMCQPQYRWSMLLNIPVHIRAHLQCTTFIGCKNQRTWKQSTGIANSFIWIFLTSNYLGEKPYIKWEESIYARSQQLLFLWDLFSRTHHLSLHCCMLCLDFIDG